jgi:hypothetical protein
VRQRSGIVRELRECNGFSAGKRFPVIDLYRRSSDGETARGSPALRAQQDITGTQARACVVTPGADVTQ